MQSRGMVASSLITALVFAPFAFAAQDQLSTVAVCAAPGVNPRVTTHLSAPLHSPRVYFRAENGPEYYVDMQQGSGDLWWAVIPAVASATRAITYRIAAQGANGNWVSGPAVTVNSTPTCPTTSMTSTDKTAADNITLGLTSAGEPATPVGFSCKGIKTIIDANGHMRPAEECRTALAKLAVPPGPVTAGTTATVSTGGLSTAMIAALAIGGAVAGYAIYHANHKNNNNVSSSRP